MVAGPSLIELPVAAQETTHGSVWISGPAEIPQALLASIETLVAQVAVALERAALADDLLRRRSDERLAALVEQASDVITVLDAELVVYYQTASACLSMGYAHGALIGAKFHDLVHPEDRPNLDGFFAALFADPTLRPEGEFRVRRGDGTWLPVEAVGSNLLHDATVDGIVVTVRDVSKRKALEDGLRRQVEELRELDQIKSDLVGNVSHELRTPLTTMVGLVAMLGEGDLGVLTAEQLWAVEAIARNNNRLLTLIEDMLTLAKIENGAFALSIEPTGVPELIADLQTTIVAIAEARSIDLAFEVDPGVGVVPADRSHLQRVLENLLSNALKFTPPGGRVRLRVVRDDGNVAFSISDTGIGMSVEDQERLFTRFFRSPTATSMAIQGTGLGLSIVKKIVDDHHGTISVESAPDVGTTVTFTIPLVPASGRTDAFASQV